jgi:REP element-mobilizing transposase RayT
VDQRAAGVYDLADHSVWCPKYRRNLPGAVPKSLDPAIRSIAAARGFEGQDLQVLADRVHLVVSAPPTESPVGIVKALKGPTAKLMLDAPLCSGPPSERDTCGVPVICVGTGGTRLAGARCQVCARPEGAHRGEA